MTEAAAQTRTVTVERTFAHPPERLWRALTQPHLLEEWLMKSDFAPQPGRHFDFRADWGSVDCQVVEVEPQTRLSYTWAAHGLESIVVWTLEPVVDGTLLRMEQSGFRADQEQAYQGARFGWQRFFGNLEQLLARAGAGQEE
jgi:uncharacterized protein YndB with AHSA1/START domain